METRSWLGRLGSSSTRPGPKIRDFWIFKNKAGVWDRSTLICPRSLLYFSGQKVWSRGGGFLRDVVFKLRKSVKFCWFSKFEKQRFRDCQSALKRGTQDLKKGQTSSNFRAKIRKKIALFDWHAWTKKWVKTITRNDNFRLLRARPKPCIPWSNWSLILIKKRQKIAENGPKSKMMVSCEPKFIIKLHVVRLFKRRGIFARETP